MKELLVIVALVSLSSAANCSSRDGPPEWPQAYSVRGIITIPYSEIEEPFYGYYDGRIGSSRIDYYGDMVKTYQISTLTPFGSMMKIVPVTTETQTNLNMCLQSNGTIDSKVGPQSVLPQLKKYRCVGTDMIDGVETQKWVYTEKNEEKISKYTMWIKMDNESPVPVRFEMRGYNSLLGSHYDHYYLTYDLFTSEAPSSNIWVVDRNMTCTSFPGPGKQAIASFNPMKEFIQNYELHIDDSWEDFKRTHNKEYESHTEHHKRRLIFKNNHRFIHSTNRARRGYQLKLNHYADWTDKELRVLRGRKYTPGGNNASAFPYTTRTTSAMKEELPNSFDWRLYGGVTPVKDQSICGSCWSFGTTGSIEGAYFVKTGMLVSLSEQALVDCSWGFGNNGCDGGEDFRSYQWMMKHGGLPLEGDYGGYLGQDSYCHIDKVNMVAPITGYVNVTPSDENALRLAIFKHGPISVAIDASVKTFTFYANGVYSDPKCKNGLADLDHAVLAVGYGELNGKRYWLVKNSWSNMWGNDGYILISSTNNECGVMTSPTYVTM